MNQTLPTADLNTAGTTDVIPSVAIDRIIAQRNEGIALFMQAMECLATARKILLDASGDIFLYGFEDCVTDSVRRMDKTEEAKRNITRLADRKIWDRLMTDTGMYTFMSSSIGINTPKRLKKHHKTDVSSTPLLLHMNGTDD